jgi:hypothetical protein
MHDTVTSGIKMHHEIVLYLKFDPVQPSSYVWVPLMYDATPFDRETDAKSVKSKVPDASRVVFGEDSYYYVMKVRESGQT